jgi:carboxyl-terminal processing protease
MSLNEKKYLKRIIIAVVLVIGVFGASFAFAQQKSQRDNKVNSFQYMKTINSVFDFVEQNYVDEVDARVLYEGALKGMLDALGDPYTLYLDEDYMRDLTDTTVGSFGGVGLSISKPTESTPEKPAYVEVASPIEDSPGAKAGIQAGDYIVAIEDRPTPEMTMNEVLGALRGEVGTSVTITILRGKNMRFDVKLVRARIEVPTAKYGMIKGTSIGYVRLIEFTKETPKRFQDALDLFEKNGYKGMIIDLRDNPGGLIDSVVNVADKFVDKGVIVSTRSRLAAENQVYSAGKDKTTIKNSVPVVVLINKGSASASEILSGFLKDYKLAYLVGERTYGKGSVQQVIPLSETDGIKITMARYYTPSDVNIDKIGIPPDKEVINIQPFTKEQEEAYVKMINSGLIEKAVEANPNMTEAQIKIKAKNIAAEYGIEERLVRRIIRNQVNRTQGAPLYDLDFDLQLKAAMEVLQGGEYKTLVKKTKTLKQLQEEVELKEKKDKKDKK